MALIKSAVKLMLKEHATYRFTDPVLMLGVPEIYATFEELVSWSKQFNVPVRMPDQVTLSPNNQARQFGWVTAQTFFDMLGLKELLSTDIEGADHAADQHQDLNDPLPDNLINRFNLVIDPGTLEHVFDMKTAFTNITRALRVGGNVVHFLPIYSFNGGYFSINPNVMMDYYALNGFSEIKAYIIMWDRYRPFTGEYRCYEYTDARMGARHSLADEDQFRFTPHLLFIARKTVDVPKIQCPQQTERHLHFRPGEPLPFELQYRINAMVERERTLEMTRQDSFMM